MNCLGNQPYLEIIEQPINKVRFRYASETGSHGPIAGATSNRKKKTFPTVKLMNYHLKKKVLIRVSLYTKEEEKHVISLKGNINGIIYEELDKNNTAIFSNLVIMSKKKDEVYKILMNKKLASLQQSSTSGTKTSKISAKKAENLYETEIKKDAKEILSSAKLCFEACFEDNLSELVCPKVFSEIIYNQKATVCSDLRIHRLSHVTGSWKGGDEVILLCDKVQKDIIEVVFYETNAHDEVIWKERAKFNPTDVHYQYAICFRTPPYTTNVEKKVFVCLQRNDDSSPPVNFTYLADDEYAAKRKRFCANTYPEEISNPSSSNTNSSEGFMKNVENKIETFNVREIFNIESENVPHSINKLLDSDFFDTSMFQDIPDYEGSEFVDLSLFDSIDTAVQGEMLTDSVSKGEPVHEGIYNQCLNLSKVVIDDDVYEENDDDVYEENDDVYEEKTLERCNKGLTPQAISFYSMMLSKRDKNGNNFLHRVVSDGSIMNIKKILKVNNITNSKLMNERNKFGHTALHLAVLNNKYHLVKLLLSEGGNPNIKDINGNTCYHLACENKFVECLNMLVCDAADKSGMDAFNYEGLAPIHIAAKNDSKGCILQLINACADVYAKEEKNGRSALHLAVEMCYPCFEIFLDNDQGFDVNIEDYEGNTPLHLAAANGFTDIVNILLSAGADPSLENYKIGSEGFGEKPEDLASNYPKILELLKHGEVQKDFLEKESFDFNSESPLNTLTTYDIITDRICKLLDPHEDKWKVLAVCIGMDDKTIQSIEKNTDSPTKALFHCVKTKYGDNFMNIMKNGLDMACLQPALKLVEEMEKLE